MVTEQSARPVAFLTDALQVAATTATAVARPKARDWHTAGSTLIDLALGIAKTPDLKDANTGRGKKVVDVPAHLFRWRQMPADPCLEVAQCASRIDIDARREEVFAESPDLNAGGNGHFDHQLIGPRLTAGTVRTCRHRRDC